MSYQRSSIRVFLIAFCCPRPFSRGHEQCTAECVAKYIERHSQVNEVLFSSLSVTWLLFRLRQSARWISPRRFTHSLLFHDRWVSAPCEAISKCIIKSNNKPTNHVNGDQERRIKKCSRSLSLSLSIRHRLSYTQGAEWGTGLGIAAKRTVVQTHACNYFCIKYGNCLFIYALLPHYHKMCFIIFTSIGNSLPR